MSWRVIQLQPKLRVLHQRPLRRPALHCCSRRVSDDASKLRNFAIVAHIDSGKTTLTESILLASKYLSSPGTVDTGSTTTDFLPAERERGITIQSASIPVKWKEWTFNLIDTPGHADFGMEVESASRVVDGAIVVIDAVEGVESQTQGVWKQLDRYQVPSRILFVNKMDRPGASFRSSLLSVLDYNLHPKPVTVTLPVASFDTQSYERAEPGIQGIVDLVEWQLWKFDKSGSFCAYPLPDSEERLKQNKFFDSSHPLVPQLLTARTALLETLAMFSEEFMELLLNLPPEPSSYLSISSDSIIPVLRAATLQNTVLPVLCGSAMKHIGTDIALNYAGLLLASPLDTILAGSNDAGVQLLAWKVTWDKRRGWMTFVRVYSGVLSKHMSLFNTTRNRPERVTKLLLLYASQPKETEVLYFGSVGVILGLKHTRTGDTLVSSNQFKSQSTTDSLRDITPPPAVMSASIIPHSSADFQSVYEALLDLSRTDPSARVELSEGQLLVHGMGALHLEIIEGRLRDEWGVRLESGRRRVTYREAYCGEEKHVDKAWTTDLKGRNVKLNIRLVVKSIEDDSLGDPTWDGNVVLNDKNESLHNPAVHFDQLSEWSHIAQGISTVMCCSPHTSLALSRISVQILGFTLPDGVGPALLAGASSTVLRNVLFEAGMGPILEPYIRLKIDVPSDHIGKVVKHLTENDSDVLNVNSLPTGVEPTAHASSDGYIPPSWISPSSLPSTSQASVNKGVRQTAIAIGPLSRMLNLSSDLRALSGGHGTFEMSSVGFRAVNKSRELEILKEIGKA